MLCKLENGHPIPCPKNGYLSNGTAVSGLDRYLENNPKVAKKEGYYPLQESAPGENDNVCTYALVDGVIVGTWSVENDKESEGADDDGTGM